MRPAARTGWCSDERRQGRPYLKNLAPRRAARELSEQRRKARERVRAYRDRQKQAVA